MITADFTYNQISLMPRPASYKKELEDCAILKTDTYIRVDVTSECFKALHRKYSKAPKPDDLSLVSSPVQRRVDGSALPPSRKPPNIFGKVSKYWKAITGPKVDEETFQARKSQCFERGGYTWSPDNGIVTEVTEDTVVIDNNTVVHFPSDEKASVKVGDAVEVGQIITEGSKPKPCAYLGHGSGDKEARHFCSACGCGARKAANLDEKLRMANVECPRTPPLFTQVTVNGGQGKGTAE